MEWLAVSVVSLFAGFVDSIVGGGGLILVPALFVVFPMTAPATLFGTNKIGSVWGTSLAAWHYARRIHFDWRTLCPSLASAFGGALLGSWVITVIAADFMRRLLPFILLAVLLHTLWRKDMGQKHQPLQSKSLRILFGCGIGFVLGFYDGFFGPGTGSFFVFAFVRLMGYDFLHASANAKLLNMATNLAAIILFGLKGYIWWHLMIPLAIANLIGSFLGTRMALRYGAGFVRWTFIGVVILLIMRSAYDGFVVWE